MPGDPISREGAVLYLVTPWSGNFSEMKLQAKVLMDLSVRSVESTVIRSRTSPTCKEKGVSGLCLLQAILMQRQCTSNTRTRNKGA